MRKSGMIYPKPSLILFSHRMKLAEYFERWADKNGVKKEWGTMIAFLDAKGMLNREKVGEFLKKEETDGISTGD